jgi:hypothetical protein
VSTRADLGPLVSSVLEDILTNPSILACSLGDCQCPMDPRWRKWALFTGCNGRLDPVSQARVTLARQAIIDTIVLRLLSRGIDRLMLS